MSRTQENAVDLHSVSEDGRRKKTQILSRSRYDLSTGHRLIRVWFVTSV